MSSYTITITPDDTSRASTTLRVDVSDNAARITELLVRAGAAAGLSPQQLPAVDLDLLLRAVTPGIPASIPAAPAQPPPAEVPASTPRRRAARSDEPATPAKRGGKRAAKSASSAEQPARAKSGKASGRGERAYRRAPADLVDVYGRLGGVTAVARHYQVPRYTAQSWVRRLRNEGQLPAGR